MTVRRLVHYEHPGAIDTPLLLLADLRMIDPAAELVHAGGERWWLGVVSDNMERRKRAEMILAQIDALEVAQRAARTVMLAKLNLQGFALITTYMGREITGTVRVEDGDGHYHCTVLEDFRERDAAWRKDQGSANVKAALLRTMREPERREAEAQMKEYLYTDGRDHYGRIMRGRVTFGVEPRERSLISPAEPLILTP